ncbi:phosphoketolase [candidate division KSB1 bacterium]|nr:phosphoketolase [candidate division KSB1 bacterium]
MTFQLSQKDLEKIDAYWQAANYLSVGQIYLKNNVLLREPLKKEHIKPRLLGHFGTVPGLNLIYVHLNRLIRDHDANIIYIAGPGHGGPALSANTFMEESFSEIYPDVEQDEHGIRKLFRLFSTPGGIPSHVSPHIPGSIHEGGELGYALVHAFGAAFDNPDLLVACVIGDGEAETGALEASWKSVRFLNPARDGAVLPILHLNEYKIAGPTVMGRTSDRELESYFQGHGYKATFVSGDEPSQVHQDFASALEKAYQEIQEIQKKARQEGVTTRPVWPVIVLRTPKGWTGPKQVDGKQIEGTFRSHQVPLANIRDNPEHLKALEAWLKSYNPDQHFTSTGSLTEDLRQLAPKADRRMSANPHANGGRLMVDLQIPDFRDYAVDVPNPGQVFAEATRVSGYFLRDIFKQNEKNKNFRIFCPDETKSNRLDAVFEVTDRCTMDPVKETDDNLAPDGRVMEVLSEHLCQGWLEGYLLTGRHGLFPCYEAFATIVDSMVNQHAKWLKTCNELWWRDSIPSLNYLLTSHAWRQDHNGYSHQGPGFIDTLRSKKGSVQRIYLPPDANTLLSVMEHCLRSRNYVNLIIAGKQSHLQWLNMDQAVEHCSRGAGVWDWASNDSNTEPDVVLACAGDVPTQETIAATWLLQKHLPELRVRVVNIVDLMTLKPHRDHPHGMDDDTFEDMFTKNRPVIFAFHGYPMIIHELVHGRANADRFHVRGYIEEGTTTTPFDMVVANEMSRYHLAMEAMRRVARLRSHSASVIARFKKKLMQHQEYVRVHLHDMEEIQNWRWTES